MASLTSSSSAATGGNSTAWASLVTGIASVVTIPIAVYLTRFIASYELLDSAWSIPVGGLFGVLAIVLARRARRYDSVRLGRAGGGGVARAGRLLGIAGLCIAAAALVSLGVYGLLEYAGTRS